MAKGKRTVALFEVIHKDKRMEPKASAAKEPAKGYSRSMAAQAVDLWKQKRADPETLTGPAPVPVPRRKSTFVPRLKAMWAEWTGSMLLMTQGVRGWVDRQMGALIGGGSAVVVISAMILARHFSTRTAQNLSIEQQLQAGPAHPAVLVGPDEKAVFNTSSPELAADVVQAKPGAAANSDGVAKPGARIVNMHYMLFQSYGDEATAKEARDFLDSRGIPCTIERGVKGWRMDFYQVIGLQGFARLRSQEYTDYKKKIKDVEDKFSTLRSYKHFEPQPIKW
jgi:hypothetical protein